MLLDRFRVARHPGFIVEGPQWSVQTENCIPPLARDGLDPVVHLTLGGLGAEVDIIGTVGVLLEALLIAIDTWQALIRLEHLAGLVVIEGK